MRNLSALDADAHICIPGDRCKDKGHWQQQQVSGQRATGGKGNWANDAECVQWKGYYKGHGGHNYDHNPIGSKGYYYDDKGKGKDRSAPSHRKGSGRGSSSHNPASHLPNKGTGKGQPSRGSAKHSRRRRLDSSDSDEIDLESMFCADHFAQCYLIKEFSSEQAREWLSSQKLLRLKQGLKFPLFWLLPNDAGKNSGSPDIESTEHFEPVKTWTSVTSRIRDVTFYDFPGQDVCPGCWHKFS